MTKLSPQRLQELLAAQTFTGWGSRSLDDDLKAALVELAELRGSAEPKAEPCLFCSKPFREHEPMILRGEEVFDPRRALVCPSSENRRAEP